jgi:hypothetical protein
MLVTTILIILFSPVCFGQPPLGKCPQRFHPQIVEFVSTLSLSFNQAGSFKDVQVLRNSLARHTDLVLHQQPRAEFEERLPVSLAQFIQNRPSHRRYNRFENIAHIRFNRQALACMS